MTSPAVSNNNITCWSNLFMFTLIADICKCSRVR